MIRSIAYILPGEEFSFAGYDWIMLHDDLAIVDFVYKRVIFDNKTTNYAVSFVRNYLNNDFYKELLEKGAKKSDFRVIHADLTSKMGEKDYGKVSDKVSLLSLDLYSRNAEFLFPTCFTTWLTTPVKINRGLDRVCTILPSREIAASLIINEAVRARPIIKLSKTTKVSIKPYSKPRGVK